MPLMTPSDVRDLFPDKLPEAKYPDSMLEGFIGAFENVVLTARGYALSETTTTEQLRSTCRGTVFLSYVPASEVTAVSWLPTYIYEGTTATTLDADALARVNLSLDKGIGSIGGIDSPEGATVTVTYKHAIPDVPADAEITCAEYVRARATRMVGNKPRNSNPDSIDDLPYRENVADPRNDKWTGMPVVDNAIAAWPDRRIPSVA